MSRLVRAVLLIVAWGATASANAVLINLGDMTLDSRTRLEWLDVTLTQGLTYDQVSAGAGGYVGSGWRYATSGELMALFNTYFVEQADTSIDTGATTVPLGPLAWLRANRLIDLLGATFSVNMPGGQFVYNDPTLPLVQISVSGYFDDLTSGNLVGIADAVAVFSARAHLCIELRQVGHFYRLCEP